MEVIRLIGLTGLAGSGKSTIAKILCDRHGFQRSKFSKVLKDMLMQIPGIIPEMIEGDLKEVPTHLLGGCSPRRAMQTLGTEWGRETLYSNLWVDCWQRSVEGISRATVEDVRFENEANKVRELGGVIWRVRRNNLDSVESHSSEIEMSGINADVVINNNGSIEELQEMLAGLILQGKPMAGEWDGTDNQRLTGPSQQGWDGTAKWQGEDILA